MITCSNTSCLYMYNNANDEVGSYYITASIMMCLPGFGTFGVPPEKTADAVRGALEAGYRHIDTAVVYQNEAQVGEAVNEWLKAGKGKREDLFIVTKIWSDQKSREGAEAAVRTSLKALGLDYIDLVSFDDSDVLYSSALHLLTSFCM